LRVVVIALFLLCPALTCSARDTIAPPPAEEPGGIKPNVITWSTASEKDSFGYDVFRGLSESGPFEAVNPDVIPGAGTTDIPQQYRFVDESVEPDTVYWYYVESISLTGERRRITPVYPSKPKSAGRTAE